MKRIFRTGQTYVARLSIFYVMSRSCHTGRQGPLYWAAIGLSWAQLIMLNWAFIHGFQALESTVMILCRCRRERFTKSICSQVVCSPACPRTKITLAVHCTHYWPWISRFTNSLVQCHPYIFFGLLAWCRKDLTDKATWISAPGNKFKKCTAIWSL